jgi:hypothetical protein
VGQASHIESDMKLLRESLAAAVERVGVAQVASRLGSKAQSSARPRPIAPVAQARRALAVAEDDVIRLRPLVEARLVDGSNGSAVLQSRAGSATVPLEARPAVEALLVRGEARVYDLGLDLARRLLTTGIAT